MAQVLKDSQRNKILASAKNEFLKKGISAATMRSISKNAGTTVGNVYRYYESKQKIVDAVLMPVLGKLNTFDNYFLNENLTITEDYLNSLLTNWVEELVEIQSDFPEEMCIVVNDEQINRHFNERLMIMLKEVVFKAANGSIDEEKLELASRIASRSTFEGIKEGMTLKCNSNICKEDFKKIMTRFVRNSFLLFGDIN